VVFLASPGDLAPERELARQIVERLNVGLAAQWGMVVDLRCWEHMGPDSGDPQDAINPHVDICDLFVGLLGESWGYPTREHTSGFEEEYTRVSCRRERTGGPDIWLYFRAIEPKRRADPGPELLKVIEFRERVRSERRHFYREFGAEDDFAVLFHDRLVLQLWDLATKIRGAAASNDATASAPAAPDVGLLDAQASTDATGYPDEVRRLTQFITSRTAGDGPNAADVEDVARLYLLSSAWFHSLRLAGVLGVHEAHVFYGMRKQLHLATEEHRLLLRSLLSDPHGAKPGYYWVRSAPDAEFGEDLAAVAQHDSEDDVRVGSLWLLTIGRYELSTDAMRALAGDPSAAVRRALLEYVETRGPAEGLPVADLLLEAAEADVRDVARRVRLALLAAADPDMAVRELSRLGVVDLDRVESATRNRLARASRDALLELLRGSAPHLRRFAASALAGRSDATYEDALILATDSDVFVASAGLLALIRLGADVSLVLQQFCTRCDEVRSQSRGFGRTLLPDAEVRRAYVRSLNYDQLASCLDFHHRDGPAAYRALALDHFERAGDRIRADLGSHFESLKQEYWRRVRRERGDLAAQALAARRRDRPGLEGLLEREFLSAALAGLAEHGAPDDVGFAREALEQGLMLGEGVGDAVRLLSKYGGPDDVPRLLAVAETYYGDVRTAAVAAAVALAPGLGGAAGRLLEAKDGNLVRMGIASLVGADGKDVRAAIWELLSSPQLVVRNAAAAYFVLTSDEEQLLQLAVAYQEQAPCYYSVVCAFDRALYAPGKLRGAFRTIAEGLLR